MSMTAAGRLHVSCSITTLIGASAQCSDNCLLLIDGSLIAQGNAVDCATTSCIDFAEQIGITASAAVGSGTHTMSCTCAYTAGPSCYATASLDYWTSP